MLPKRDGPQSDASVQMYREKAIGSGTQDPENCEAVFQPNLSSIELVDTRSDEEVLAGIGFSQDERRSPTGHAQPDSAERAVGFPFRLYPFPLTWSVHHKSNLRIGAF